MSAAAFQLLTARMKQALADAGVAQRVDRGRLAPVPIELASVVVVRFDRASGRTVSMEGHTDWDVAVAVDVYQRVSDGTDPEDAAGTVLNAAFNVLRTMDTTGLGGMQVADAPEVVAAPSDDLGLMCLTLFLSVQLRTAPNTFDPQD
jgi:hypothetical protein